MELNKIILESTYEGFKNTNQSDENGFGLNWKDIKMNEIKQLKEDLFKFGINPMFDVLELGEPQNKVKFSILSHVDFAYHNFVNSDPDGFEMCECMCLKSSVDKYLIDTCKMTNAEEYVLTNYGDSMAFANNNIVYINKAKAYHQVGLHLICHEIMHILANKTTVAEMCKSDSNFQDEAVNEFFARLATYFYINNTAEKQDERLKIAGLTKFNNDLFNTEPHDAKLGLYGYLLETDQYLKHSTWNEGNCVQLIKNLANYYFKGGMI